MWSGRGYFIIFLVGFLTIQPEIIYGAEGMASFAPLVKKVLPAVVNIAATHMPASGGQPVVQGHQDPLKAFLHLHSNASHGNTSLSKVASLGSGFFVSKDGYIVTNRHVVAQADHVIVTTNAGKDYKAKVIGKDIRTDIALLKIMPQAKDAKAGFPYLEFGEAKSLEVGDWILAIGNPFGLGGSVTAGIVSSRSRDIASQASTIPVASYVGDLIQTDAAINVGNSGGPMISTEGKVVGVNFAIYASSGNSIGIGFAVPSSIVQKAIQQIKTKGHVSYGWAGLHVQEVTPSIAQSVGLKTRQGAMVVSLIEGGPAKKSGLRIGDIILRIGATVVHSFEKVPRIIGDLTIGKPVALKIWRDGQEKVLNVMIETVPSEAAPAPKRPQYQPGAANTASKKAPLGMGLIPLQPHMRLNLGVPEDVVGMMVNTVLSASLAEAAGIQPGDIAIDLEGVAVRSLSTIEHALIKAQRQGKKAVLLKIHRQGQDAFVGIPLALKT